MDMRTEYNGAIKVEDNLSFDQEFIATEDVYYHNMLFHSSLPKYIDTGENEFEVENGDLDHQDINQENVSSEHNTLNDLLYKPTKSEDYVTENIEAENDDVSMIQTKDCNFDCRLATKKVDTEQGTAAGCDIGSCMTVHKNHLHDVRVYTAKKSYSCNICNKTFSMKNNLTLHISEHSTKQCFGEVCNESIRTISSVSNHMSTVYSKNTYSWHESNKKFEDKANGTKNPNATKSYSCDKVLRHNSNLTEKTASVQPLTRDVAIEGIKLECDDSDKQGRTNQEHLTNNDMFGGSTTTEDFVIDICPYQTNSEPQLLSHLKAHTAVYKNQIKLHSSKKTYSCDICTKKFCSKSKLTVHLRIHSGEKPFSCEVCHKAFSQKHCLIAHLRIHSGENPFSCEVCHKAFRQKQCLIAHLRIHSGENPFSCEICHKAFRQKKYLIAHLRIHSGEKPFSCEICHKAFYEKSNLITHLRIHSGEKPFSCEICHKAFNEKKNLAAHLRIHSGEKPFSCEVCRKAFNQKNCLIAHMRIHSGEKPFSCEVCHKAFRQKKCLIVHLRIHSGEKPFSCEVCHKAFSIKNYLTVHLRIHSGEKPFSCKVCHKTFSTRYYVARHMSIHKGEMK